MIVLGRGYETCFFCCNGDFDQPGCELCDEGHVHQSNKWSDNEGFLKFLPPLPSSSDDQQSNAKSNVYALDCEMVYTTKGLELARLSVINAQLEVVLDKLVKPDEPIIDCNSRFSGLQLDQIEQATEHLTDIQLALLHLFDSETILIGHSLESDLLALKLIHGKVVDTSVMFPHRLGPPKKRSLRNLVADILFDLIQQDSELLIIYLFVVRFS